MKIRKHKLFKKNLVGYFKNLEEINDKWCVKIYISYLIEYKLATENKCRYENKDKTGIKIK